jgi:hypothetical protein
VARPGSSGNELAVAPRGAGDVAQLCTVGVGAR